MPKVEIANGVTYGFDDALHVVLGYCCGQQEAEVSTRRRPPDGIEFDSATRPAFAFAFYDAVPRQADSTESPLANEADVLVANGLNAKMTGRHIAQLVSALPQINGQLAKIPVESNFMTVADEGLARYDSGDDVTRAMWRAWWAAARLRWIDAARTNKLLHRVRPDLFPLYDNLTAGFLGDNAWGTIRRTLERSQDFMERLSRELEGSASQIPGGRVPGLLRLHDILLWCHASQNRQYARDEGAKIRSRN